MVEVFRRRVIKLLVDHELLNENFARNLLSWKHSGFSIDNSVRILDESAQESLAEYIARPPRMHGRAVSEANDQPISLKKIHYEPFVKGRVIPHPRAIHIPPPKTGGAGGVSRFWRSGFCGVRTVDFFSV